MGSNDQINTLPADTWSQSNRKHAPLNVTEEVRNKIEEVAEGEETNEYIENINHKTVEMPTITNNETTDGDKLDSQPSSNQ